MGCTRPHYHLRYAYRTERMPRLDPHSYADNAQPKADFLVWRATLDFATRALACDAILRFQKPALAGPLDLDTRDLDTLSVADQDGKAFEHELSKPKPILGCTIT
jgi:hypothetical protein